MPITTSFCLVLFYFRSFRQYLQDKMLTAAGFELGSSEKMTMLTNTTTAQQTRYRYEKIYLGSLWHSQKFRITQQANSWKLLFIEQIMLILFTFFCLDALEQYSALPLGDFHAVGWGEGPWASATPIEAIRCGSRGDKNAPNDH